MASGGLKRRIQLTGFRKREKKALVELLFKMDCVFFDNKKYRNCTHLIAKKLCKSEKFLAACAAGKWILTKEYIINSAESGRWLDETTYEWGYKIEKDTHYSPQMQSAPKRWRKELTQSSAPGAFHRWKVILAVKEGDKRMTSVIRVLQAGKATICSSQYMGSDITHIFVHNKFYLTQNEKRFSEDQCYPLQYIGDYLLEKEMQNIEVTQMNHFLPARETDQNESKVKLVELKNAVIKHMYFAETAKQISAHKDQLNKCNPKIKNTNLSRITWHIFEGLVEEHLLPDVISELAAVQKYSIPPVHFFHSLLEHVLLGNTDAVFLAKFHHVLYLVLQLDPPWKSPSTLRYYLDFLQCPICKKGTWSFIEMLVRSCLYCRTICHAVPGSGKADEQRIVHKTLLKFFFDLVKAEVEFLTKSLVEETNSQHQQVMPQTVLLKTFWLGSETSVLFTKHINILADWVILSHRELNRTNDAHCNLYQEQRKIKNEGLQRLWLHMWVTVITYTAIDRVKVFTQYFALRSNDEETYKSVNLVWLNMWLEECRISDSLHRIFLHGGERCCVDRSDYPLHILTWTPETACYRTYNSEAFRCEIAALLKAILGTVVEYWIISGLLMDRNVFCQIADDLAQYIAIACDDFSIHDLQMFICTIPSLWLQMFVAEAVFKKLCLQRNVTISTEPLSLQKIVCSYLPALRELGMCETRKICKAKKKKTGRWPCPESQRALQMLNGDKQNQVKVLPDLPDLVFRKCCTRTRRAREKVGASDTKENCYILAEEAHFYRRNVKGETALHEACIRNKVERLIQLLSSPGIDINVKDHAGWTPLHEACNHGSTVCVHEILQRCPEVDLLSQVDGVTPLHDALSNGHVEIGKLLLQHGGPVLLQQRDSNGKLPLDYVQSLPVKQELLNIVHPEEKIGRFYERTEQDYCSQQRELWLILFNKMLLNFCSVYNLFSPFTSTLRKVACSSRLPVRAHDYYKMESTFSADWLVDMYFRELETFKKLPQFLQEISTNIFLFPGEQMKALLATLETVVEANQLFT